MDGQPQFISPGQWQAVKNTVSALDASEANEGGLPDWWGEFRDQLSTLLVSSTYPVQPFAVTGHFLWLLERYVEGSKDQDELGQGTRLALEWAQGTIDSAAQLDQHPEKNGERTVWVVMQSVSAPE